MVTFPPSCTRLACVAVDELVPMWPVISLWIQFWNLLFPTHLLLLFILLVVWTLFPVPFCIRILIVAVIVLLKYANILFEALIWAMTSLSEKAASVRLSSAKWKSCYDYSSWLACWNHDWVAFKQCASRSLLYSKAKNILKLAHVFSALGFLRQSLHTSV